MKFNRLCLILMLIPFVSCNESKKTPVSSISNINYKENLFEDNWQYLDIQNDTIPGVSLDKAYKEIFYNKNGKNVVVAVLDTEVDIDHPALKENIWINTKEIKDNNIDDDNNGYIDDIYGWNFLGNSEGKNVFYQQYEITRIVKKYRSDIELLENSDVGFNLFFQAEKELEKQLKQANRILKIAPVALNSYRRELSNPYLPEDESISIELLDSLIENNIITKNDVSTIYKYKRIKLTLKRLEADSTKYQLRKDYHLNLDYNDKIITGDNPDNFEDTIYGNNIVNSNTEKLYHGTKVSGSIIGINDKIIKSNLDINKKLLKIMPICIASNGDEHDKDIYLGLKYAVNQGAKIINISTGKEYSLYNHKVQDAIKYAEEKDVLIIMSAGNSALNLDIENNHYYPSDVDFKGKEIFDNVIRVGASGYSLNKSLKASFSNYGKKNVDIFAPGIGIYTTSALDETGYEIARGTSHATPIVSRVAALIRSYYPSLTASEVKQILMDSSVKYDILVDVPTKENPEQQLPFSELSKSGGIVNAYNAMLMAEEYIKAKRK